MSARELPRDMHCVLVPVGTVHLLLPNAIVAEVMNMPALECIRAEPDWLSGRFAWRGWSVPLVAFSKLTGTRCSDADSVARVVVLKALSAHPRLPFVAVVSHGFPRLKLLKAEQMIPSYGTCAPPPGVKAQLLVREDSALIPDLEKIEGDLIKILDLDPT